MTNGPCGLPLWRTAPGSGSTPDTAHRGRRRPRATPGVRRPYRSIAEEVQTAAQQGSCAARHAAQQNTKCGEHAPVDGGGRPLSVSAGGHEPQGQGADTA